MSKINKGLSIKLTTKTMNNLLSFLFDFELDFSLIRHNVTRVCDRKVRNLRQEKI